mmetsp:Transcript_34058/g.63571  ORF Transcript_34058/g.63571 Transcript_34058/m.63571 type:complete len:204 (+) Transcript_34058:48-659(+)
MIMGADIFSCRVPSKTASSSPWASADTQILFFGVIPELAILKTDLRHTPTQDNRICWSMKLGRRKEDASVNTKKETCSPSLLWSTSMAQSCVTISFLSFCLSPKRAATASCCFRKVGGTDVAAYVKRSCCVLDTCRAVHTLNHTASALTGDAFCSAQRTAAVPFSPQAQRKWEAKYVGSQKRRQASESKTAATSDTKPSATFT